MVKGLVSPDWISVTSFQEISCVIPEYLLGIADAILR